MASRDLWAGVGSALAFLAGLITLAMNQTKIKLLLNKIMACISPNIQITFPEYTADSFERSELFVAIEAYISGRCADGARKLKGDLGRGENKSHFVVDDDQEVIDIFKGTKLRWYADTVHPSSNFIIAYGGNEERRFYRVAFHRMFRDKVVNSYLPYVLDEGRKVIATNRQRRLFTNNPNGDPKWWSEVAFQHPATFDTLAMDPMKKKIIIDDLNAFLNGKDYYTKVGRAWKRGYLLFGPPGTGKSTMIAAISNHLKYDIYDLELTAVSSNTELRRLFIETKGKSIIVIEDIDRSIDITNKRRDNKSGGGDMTLLKKKRDDDGTKLTLSGILNFIDGLWSACGGERIIIFTTNNMDKLDPALIRPGRMDMPIEMSYCCYEAFKVLANNYLDISITEYQLFEQFVEIRQLLGEVNMPPAQVAGYLMRTGGRPADACLNHLVGQLRKAKGNAKEKEQVVEVVLADVK